MNSFLSLFYIAFYLQDMDRLQDVSETEGFVEAVWCSQNGMTKLFQYFRAFAFSSSFFQQLAAIFITRQVIGNVKEAIIPFVIEKLKLYKIGYDMTAAMSPDTLERHMREMTGEVCVKSMLQDHSVQVFVMSNFCNIINDVDEPWSGIFGMDSKLSCVIGYD